MMAARFQVVSVPRTVKVPVSQAPDAQTRSEAQLPDPQERGFAWRFLSANNRNLAKSARSFADVESCLASIRTLQEALPLALGETVHSPPRQWVWRVRVNDEVLAIAARSYSRQLRAQLTCNIFLQSAAETVPTAPVQVLHPVATTPRSGPAGPPELALR